MILNLFCQKLFPEKKRRFFILISMLSDINIEVQRGGIRQY